MLPQLALDKGNQLVRCQRIKLHTLPEQELNLFRRCAVLTQIPSPTGITAFVEGALGLEPKLLDIH
jgi:hypothetical protein